jgi:hypothetical protein
MLKSLFRSLAFCAAVFITHSSALQAIDHASIVISDEKCRMLIEHLKSSIAMSYIGSSKLPQEVLSIQGMSSSKVRHFLNNLCSLPGTNYLEIGVWRGSTWISALYGNQKSINKAIAIDNWSEFGGPYSEFVQNCRRFLPNTQYEFYSADCFAIEKSKIFKEPVNIYFYDGEHSAISQELAFTFYDDRLDDVFIAVVDDWNFPSVPQGTREAFEKLNYEILFEAVLPASHNGDLQNWWNGLYVAVIRKTR